MRGNVWAIVAGLVLAIFGAAVVAKIFELPLVELVAGEKPIWHILRLALPIAAFAVPGALAAILLSEGFRVRGFFYWLAAGVILAVLAHITLTGVENPRFATFQSTRTFNTLLGMGVIGSIVYWMIAGYRAGRMASAIALLGRATDLDERGLRKRCRSCSIASLALGLLPLALVGWHAIYKPSPSLPVALAAKAAADGSKTLADAGLSWARLKIEDHVGHIAGIAPDSAARASAFEKAKTVLDPMVGLPGVVAYLQNDLTVADTKPAEEPQSSRLISDAKPQSAEGAKKLKPVDELRLAMEAKAKADADAKAKAKALAEAKKDQDDAAAIAKAKEEQRFAQEAKKRADEALAKARAEEEIRLAAEAKKKAEEEAAAKARAAEEARVAAEAKKKADEEAAAKAKAEEEVRVAAEAKKNADEEAAAKARAAEEARIAAEAKKAEDEAAANARAEEEARVAAEARKKADEEAAAKAKAEEEVRLAAEAKKKAEEEAAAKAKAAEDARVAAEAKTAAPVAQAVAAAASPPASMPSVTTADTQCSTDFSDAARTSTIRFDINSNSFDPTVREVIARYVDIAKRCGNYRLKIAGHADRTGRADVNQHVSLARAIAVREALIASGIPAARVDAEGFGANRLVDLAKTRAANRVNRRVEIAAVSATGQVAQAAIPAVTQPVQMPVEQCNSEFARALQSDTIRFIGASAIVDDKYGDYLDWLAQLALGCPSHTINIGGHTDRRGSAAYNDALSLERAHAVRDALVDRDIPESRLSAAGYGGQRPFDPANTPAAYALNRRVDFGVAVKVLKSQ